MCYDTWSFWAVLACGLREEGESLIGLVVQDTHNEDAQKGQEALQGLWLWYFWCQP